MSIEDIELSSDIETSSKYDKEKTLEDLLKPKFEQTLLEEMKKEVLAVHGVGYHGRELGPMDGYESELPEAIVRQIEAADQLVPDIEYRDNYSMVDIDYGIRTNQGEIYRPKKGTHTANAYLDAKKKGYNIGGWAFELDVLKKEKDILSESIDHDQKTIERFEDEIKNTEDVRTKENLKKAIEGTKKDIDNTQKRIKAIENKAAQFIEFLQQEHSQMHQG